MELESLKKSWETLDKKIQQATAFNQKLVDSIISASVMTTVDKLKRLYNSFYILLTLEIIVLVGILLGNPFDFKYQLQFVPFILLLIGVIIAFVNLLKISFGIVKISPTARIDIYVKSIVSIYDRNKRFEKWFGILFLSVGLMLPISFLPQKIERLGLQVAFKDIAIMTLITLLLYIVAFKLGAFKNRHRDKLEKDLAEWEELKLLAHKMNDE